MSKAVKDIVNALQREHKLIMIQCSKGKLYFLLNHWKHADWKKNSKKTFIGKGTMKKEYNYLTEPI